MTELSQIIVQGAYRRRLLLSVVLMAIIAVLFWTSSRYPALDEKAMMSGAIQLEDPLSFEAALPIVAQDPVLKRIVFSTLNWFETNRIGMTFGVLFGAAFLTLLGYLQRRSFKGAFSNAILGMAVGAPLGVCVNCAAPIAKGLYDGGARIETTLTAMIASPTLNVVVLTMTFSLLPFYLALAKLALSVTLMLLVVPFVCRFLSKHQLQRAQPIAPACELRGAPPAEGTENALSSIVEFGKDFARNLWFIVRKTIPLMLLAGFLGAALATALPPELLARQPFSLVTLIFVAIAGTVAPVPIGFDVVLSAALLNGGVPVGYVMTLLFTLGVFSIYSFFIVSSTISLRPATVLSVVIIAFGILAGMGAQTYHRWQIQQALELLSGPPPVAESTPAVESPQLASPAAAMQSKTTIDTAEQVTIARTDFRPRSSADGPAFTQMEAWHIGIDKPLEFSFADMWPPFWEGRSISSGDFDNDGDVDVVLASTERGLYFYANDGRGKFVAREFELGGLRDIPIFNAALVDIDNDGWLDIFFTTYQQGNYWLPNRSGTFDARDQISVRNRSDAILTMALSFADIEGDGDLDVALGNWAAGWYRRVPGEESRNRIVFNNDGVLDGEDYADLPGLPGETLTILFSDINSDSFVDLLVGNDFEQPDVFYLGGDGRSFVPIRRQDGIIPLTTTTTMSLKTADLSNDGKVALYAAQIAGRSSGISERLKMRPIDLYCSELERPTDIEICQRNIDIKRWYRSGHSFDPAYAHRCQQLEGRYRRECRGMLVKDLAIQKDDAAVCALIPADQTRARQYCEIHFREIRTPSDRELAESIVQILARNVLLVPDANGIYAERAVEMGLEVGGWSWDVKIGDFDNDEWQDIYIVNGTWVPNEVSPSNLFFHSQNGAAFVEASGRFGLEDYLMTAAATQFDMDGDGDLDVISVPVNGPVKAFVNNGVTGNAIQFRLRDAIGNRFGIGAIVEIYYGDQSRRQQSRELQVGGGFMSFDAPLVHFGLGDYQRVDQVVVRWADGGVSRLDEGLDAGALYQIERNRAPASATLERPSSRRENVD